MILDRENKIKQEIISFKCKNEDLNLKLKCIKEANEKLVNELESTKAKYKKVKDQNSDKRPMSYEENENIKRLIEENSIVKWHLLILVNQTNWKFRK